jgi:hypothetical protein
LIAVATLPFTHGSRLYGAQSMALLSHSFDPTPDEIEAACAALRRGWTIAERERRRAGPIRSTPRSTRRLDDHPLLHSRVELTPSMAAELSVLR